ncbi:MAG TPA: hypothetical protein VFV11_08235 [Solimonas sp.]|nr:hypothetical protein [Solimonas sp.]
MQAATQPPPDPRHCWIDAGAALAPALTRPDELTAERLAQASGRPAAEFAALWSDPVNFRIELLARLLDEVRDSVAKNTAGMAPGLMRAKLATEAYLEANLERHLLRRLVFELRHLEEGAAVIRARAFGFMMMMKLELHAMGRTRTEAISRLMTAAVLETAVAEFEAERALPEMRQVIFSYFNRSRA